MSFVNSQKSIDGGTHQNGFIAGVAKAIKIASGCKLNASIWKQPLSYSLMSAVNVNMSDPRYASSVKDRLRNPEVFLITKEITSNYLSSYFYDNKLLFEKLMNGFIQQYLQIKWNKIQGYCDVPSSEFAQEQLNNMFDEPKKYKAIVKDYKLTEVCIEICQKMQEDKKIE